MGGESQNRDLEVGALTGACGFHGVLALLLDQGQGVGKAPKQALKQRCRLW